MISNQKATIMFLMSVFGSLFFIGKILKIELMDAIRQIENTLMNKGE